MLATPIQAANPQLVGTISTSTGGRFPEIPMLQGSDGNLYGTTSIGGVYSAGTVFKMTPAGNVTLLASFNRDNGTLPSSLIEGQDGNFYGTTFGGGSSQNNGVVFKMTPAGVLSVLAVFTQSLGDEPSGLTQAADGTFYGLCADVGKGGQFKLTAAGVLTIATSFPGFFPGQVLGPDGNYYGVKNPGDGGSIIKTTPAGVETTLVTFTGKNGYYPNALILGSDGNFYGTTDIGGPRYDPFIDRPYNEGYGTVFKITPKGVLTTLHAFDGSDGIYPRTRLVEGPDGYMYGTAIVGGSTNGGVVYKISRSGNFKVVTHFTGKNGYDPNGGLVLATDGSFYGSTYSGGFSDWGTLYKVTNSKLVPLVSFGSPEGDLQTSQAPLVQGADGNFYGTTVAGGASNNGTFFRMTPSGVFTTLSSFTGYNGREPQRGVLRGPDDNFYGVTAYGGEANLGSVYRVTPDGLITTIFSFHGTDGANPSGLMLGKDVNFYGTTFKEASVFMPEAPGYGIVFKLTPAGKLTRLAKFEPTVEGYPNGNLIEGRDGNFYGTTKILPSESSAGGTVFKVTPGGVKTILVNFTGANGKYPLSGVVEAPEGGLYGTTSRGGTTDQGTIFKVMPNGVFKTLISFKGSNGDRPQAGLLLGKDGNFYGTTRFGGTLQSAGGTVFEMTPAGYLTSLASFSYTIGLEYPASSLCEGPDGRLYGITESPYAVYAVTPPKPQTITFPPVGPVVIGQTVTLHATDNSGLPITYRVLGGPATLNGNQIAFTGGGAVRIIAYNRGNIEWQGAEAVQVVIVPRLTQTISPFAAIPTKFYPSAPFTIPLPVANSGLPVTVAVKAGPATISGNTITLTGTGNVLLVANQNGNADYAPAKTVSIRFLVTGPK